MIWIHGVYRWKNMFKRVRGIHYEYHIHSCDLNKCTHVTYWKQSLKRQMLANTNNHLNTHKHTHTHTHTHTHSHTHTRTHTHTHTHTHIHTHTHTHTRIHTKDINNTGTTLYHAFFHYIISNNNIKSNNWKSPTTPAKKINYCLWTVQHTVMSVHYRRSKEKKKKKKKSAHDITNSSGGRTRDNLCKHKINFITFYLVP